MQTYRVLLLWALAATGCAGGDRLPPLGSPVEVDAEAPPEAPVPIVTADAADPNSADDVRVGAVDAEAEDDPDGPDPATDAETADAEGDASVPDVVDAEADASAPDVVDAAEAVVDAEVVAVDAAPADAAPPAGCVEGEARACPGCAGVQQVCVAGEFTACIGPDELCNAFDDDCDGRIDEAADGAPLRRVCYRGPQGTQNLGVCSEGVEVCEMGRFGACMGQIVPSDEACNLADDDCDGVTDESGGGLALASACYEGPADTEGRGVCRAGARLCQGGVAGACQDQVLPAVEICDGLDNDCDGVVDDGVDGCECAAGETRPCYSGAPGTQNVGRCIEGRQACGADGRFGACEGEVAPAPETCDGVDEDCNGRVDDDVPGTGAPCVGGVGRCAAEGEVVCDANAGALVCAAVLGAPADEVCDGEDDDCDGAVDEGFELGSACALGQGVCRADGRVVCEAGGQATCDAAPRAPGAEQCNRLDDDCDGGTDEGLRLDEVCTVGVGACVQVGALVCDANGGVRCSAAPGPGGPETCNGVDDDCDGRTDEAVAEAGAPCETGLAGTCGAGVQACVSGRIACEQRVRPSAEVCNGLDDDCDGAVDLDGVGAPLVQDCYGGPVGTSSVGLCRAGRSTCHAGAFGACDGEVQPAAETCNGADDDCDGSVDDVDRPGGCNCAPGTVRDCYDGAVATRGVGVCQAGVQVCLADGSGYGGCGGQVLPGIEVCNGLDDDCDGAPDDVVGAGTACSSGQGVCARPGLFQCDAMAGQLLCDAVAGPAGAEVCNGLDDDCDGVLDDVVGVGEACRAGADGDGCRAAGTLRCPAGGAGAPVCVPSAAPGVEVCNGVDDDDDLCTDEGNLPGTGVACAVGQGACFRNGATVCGGAQGIVCGQAPGMPAPERCNAIDDDCDARTDEASNDVGGACAAGIGACRRQGVVVCNGGAPQCTAVAGNPVGERCNGTDDDCDGASDEGGVCDVFASCRAARAAGRDTSGIYRIGSVGAAVDVYCDQATDGGGWTLVASTRTTTLNDESAAWYADLTTLAPVSPNAGVWNGLRGLAARHDVRFACRDAVRAADAAMTVDLSFYDMPWYTEWTTGTDAQSCFSEADGAGEDLPQPARRNNLTAEALALGTPWAATDPFYPGANYLEGEDACADTSDFTVDFRDRGMDSNQSDGTDWGEDDTQLKCGRSGLADGQWFVFAREVLGAVAPLACPGDDPYEQNDDRAGARLLPDPAAWVFDGILCGADDDWFALDLQEGCTYRFQLDFVDADGDVDLYVVNANDGAALGQSSGVTDQESVLVSIPAGAAVRAAVQVDGFLFGAGDSNSYRASFQRVSCP
jgi:hypothetical protein